MPNSIAATPKMRQVASNNVAALDNFGKGVDKALGLQLLGVSQGMHFPSGSRQEKLDTIRTSMDLTIGPQSTGHLVQTELSDIFNASPDTPLHYAKSEMRHFSLY